MRLSIGQGDEAARALCVAAQVPGTRMVVELASSALTAAPAAAIGDGVSGVVASVAAPSARRALARLTARSGGCAPDRRRGGGPRVGVVELRGGGRGRPPARRSVARAAGGRGGGRLGRRDQAQRHLQLRRRAHRCRRRGRRHLQRFGCGAEGGRRDPRRAASRSRPACSPGRRLAEAGAAVRPPSAGRSGLGVSRLLLLGELATHHALLQRTQLVDHQDAVQVIVRVAGPPRAARRPEARTSCRHD